MALSAGVSVLQYPLFAIVKGRLGGDPFYVGFYVSAAQITHPSLTSTRDISWRTSADVINNSFHTRWMISTQQTSHQ